MKAVLFVLICCTCCLTSVGQRPLNFNETFALYVKGRGYIKYQDRNRGINLGWSDLPVYEWKIVLGEQRASVPSNTAVALFNLTRNDYVIYARREYGINLDWLKGTGKSNARDWLLDGGLAGPQICTRLRNVTQKGKNENSYLSYGKRDNGIDLVWSSSPSACNIQLLQREIMTRVDSRTSIPLSSTEENRRYEQATKQMDVLGSDFEGEQFIGMAPAERSNRKLLQHHNDTWYPIDGFKRTVCGKLTKYFPFDGSIFTDNDDDLNLNIVPSNDFRHLLTKATEIGNRRANKNSVFEHIQAEIDVIDAPYKDYFYPSKRYAPPLNEKVCAYGPFVTDKGHSHKPEIHTAEQIWWKAGRTYLLSFMCDNSGRFDGLLYGDFPPLRDLNNTGDDYDTDNGKHSFNGPWAPKPIKGTYAIAFKIKLGQERAYFEVGKITGLNFASVQAQPANAHLLVYQSDTIALVRELDELDMNVTFEKVVRMPASSPQGGMFIQGYVVLEAKTGKAFSGYENGKRTDDAGQLLVKVTKTLFAKNAFPSFRKLLPQ